MFLITILYSKQINQTWKHYLKRFFLQIENYMLNQVFYYKESEKSYNDATLLQKILDFSIIQLSHIFKDI